MEQAGACGWAFNEGFKNVTIPLRESRAFRTDLLSAGVRHGSLAILNTHS